MALNQNELKHYGVLGMKWGIRRYENKDGTLTAAGKKRYGDEGKYTYRSFGTKHNLRKMNKALKKGDVESAKKFEQRAKRSAELDAREEQYARSVTAGGNILSRLFIPGGPGGKSYQRTLAVLGGNGKNSSLAKKSMALGMNLVPPLLTTLTGVPLPSGYALSVVAKAAYIRQDEKTSMGRMGKSLSEFGKKHK